MAFPVRATKGPSKGYVIDHIKALPNYSFEVSHLIGDAAKVEKVVELLTII